MTPPKPGKRGITDGMRLDFLAAHPEFTMDWFYGESYGIKMSPFFRQAIDAAIRAAKGKSK